MPATSYSARLSCASRYDYHSEVNFTAAVKSIRAIKVLTFTGADDGRRLAQISIFAASISQRASPPAGSALLLCRRKHITSPRYFKERSDRTARSVSSPARTGLAALSRLSRRWCGALVIVIMICLFAGRLIRAWTRFTGASR